MEEEIFLKAHEGPEQELIALILKYRDAVNKEQYLPVSQREADRARLSALYRRLHTLRQRILDSRCYLELGKLQRQLSHCFLADETTHAQRLGMLAYLLRCLCHPIVFMAGRNTLSRLHPKPGQEMSDAIERQPPMEFARKAPKFRSRPLNPEEIQKIQGEIRDLVARYPKLKQWQKRLSIAQAEILSQMAASGQIEITVEGEPAGLITTIVLKGGPDEH